MKEKRLMWGGWGCVCEKERRHCDAWLAGNHMDIAFVLSIYTFHFLTPFFSSSLLFSLGIGFGFRVVEIADITHSQPRAAKRHLKAETQNLNELGGIHSRLLDASILHNL
ncbi:unnamed protein product [Sphenostylis stenocarpa]|uniref:Uncharacterized protein n=1 Tax=Sphenostylis stenocarpa TaxID=92480 RepID=A0AA86SRG0_9FABA|nr:unnamed protein product [Sphenostylis stenocarpa]